RCKRHHLSRRDNELSAEQRERCRKLLHNTLEFGGVGYVELGDKASGRRLSLLRMNGGASGKPDGQPVMSDPVYVLHSWIGPSISR
ncbi:MAG TPA: hypothetical protein VNX28_02520, partial [Gemmataceae bacterium]|nr:hypothetical protein [Gemmataceae bacterium]